jgi:arsenate reductase
MKYYHNPRCRKSREALALLEEKGIKPEIVEYLKTPLSSQELTDLTRKLGIKPEELIRKGEDVFKNEYRGKELTDQEWIDAMVSHPKLMERPILENGGVARVGRPPEKVLEII